MKLQQLRDKSECQEQVTLGKTALMAKLAKWWLEYNKAKDKGLGKVAGQR